VNRYEITSRCSEHAATLAFSIHGSSTVLEKEMEKGNLKYEVWFIKITTKYCLKDKNDSHVTSTSLC